MKNGIGALPAAVVIKKPQYKRTIAFLLVALNVTVSYFLRLRCNLW